MNKNWDEFLTPYKQAVDELKIKLRGIRTQCDLEKEHSPIEFVTGRVKPISSIIDKAMQKHISEENLEVELQDIAGLRIMCQFVDDIKYVVILLRQRTDFQIIEERDYITNKKASGYRSYHVVIEYPVQTIHGEKKILAEIQIRTLAMNFWATIEHSLNYKYNGQFPDALRDRLESLAEAAFHMDEEMSQIKSEIQEAQKYVFKKRGK